MVILGDKTINYEEGKQGCSPDGTFKFLPSWDPQSEATDLDGWVNTHGTRGQRYGNFVSGSSVRTDAQNIIKRARKFNRSIDALDMEASAFSKSCHHAKVQSIGIIKGKSDNGDEDKQAHNKMLWRPALKYTASTIEDWVKYSLQLWKPDTSAVDEPDSGKYIGEHSKPPEDNCGWSVQSRDAGRLSRSMENKKDPFGDDGKDGDNGESEMDEVTDECRWYNNSEEEREYSQAAPENIRHTATSATASRPLTRRRASSIGAVSGRLSPSPKCSTSRRDGGCPPSPDLHDMGRPLRRASSDGAVSHRSSPPRKRPTSRRAGGNPVSPVMLGLAPPSQKSSKKMRVAVLSGASVQSPGLSSEKKQKYKKPLEYR